MGPGAGLHGPWMPAHGQEPWGFKGGLLRGGLVLHMRAQELSLVAELGREPTCHALTMGWVLA